MLRAHGWPAHGFVLAMVASFLAAGTADAQWQSDPDSNLAIADRSGEQVLPKIATSPDGTTYVSWFDHSSGNYDVYLQRLSPSGIELWPHNGLLVSNHAQSSSLVEWDLIVDTAGNAVLVFTDTRGAGDLDVQAYKIGPAGQFLWGPDGITLSASTDFEPSPRVTEATDGDFVFVWSRLPSVGDGKIMLQRLAPDGTRRYALGGLAIAGDANEDASFPAIVPSLAGSVIVAWVRDTSTFQSPRNIRARRFAPDGTPLWANHVPVFDAGSVPIAYQPKLMTDGAGGALVLWHRSAGNLFNSFVQRLAPDGTEIFAHNGAPVATSNLNHLDPALAFQPATGESFVFWNERNSAQSQWGIYAQKLTAIGSRAWGDNGLVLVPVNTTLKFLPRAVPVADGAAVFFGDEPTGQFNRDRVLGIRVDPNSNLVWGANPVVVSSHLSSKVRLPVTVDSNGVSRMVWEDNRSGEADVYGQNVNLDGTLGTAVTAVEEGAAPGSSVLRLLANRPNPFRDRTMIEIGRGGSSASQVVISDVVGRIVRRLDAPAGEIVTWDGRSDARELLPSGVYFYRLLTPLGESRAQKAILAR